jgi:hypothetical protein
LPVIAAAIGPKKPCQTQSSTSAVSIIAEILTG